MRILHFITSLKIGGAEQALCSLLALLKRQGSEHHVAYLYEGPHVLTLQNLGIPSYKITGLFHHYDPLALYRLKKLISTLKPDILHTSLWSANIMGRLLGKMCNLPVVSDLHGNCIYEGLIRNTLDRLTASWSNYAIAVSDSVRKAYQQHIMPATKASSLITINNGIDVDSLHGRAAANPLTHTELGIENDTFIVGAIGRLEAIKSYHILLEAFALWLDNASCIQKRHLIMVGGGSQSDTLQQLAHNLNIAKHVTFTGARMDAYRFYPLFNCFVLSSQSEGLSLALLEAMSFGLPIISTAQAQQHDIIKQGINGLLIEPHNPQALAKALQQLHANSSLQSDMQHNNVTLIRQSYTCDHVVQGYQKIFNSCLNRGKNYHLPPF